MSTAAAPISEQRLAANRANAALSSGPRTEEGKARSSQNARRHGFYADPAVANPEDAAELAQLREDLVAFNQPINSQELVVIDKIARAQQAILRAYRLESAIFASLLNPATAAEGEPPSANPLGDNFLRMDHKIWSGFLRYKTHADNAYHRAMDELDRYKSIRHLLPPSQRQLPTEPSVRNEPTAPPPNASDIIDAPVQ